ncbi:MAG: type I-E CRISPR-associated protein Cse1/CasA [Armatimonadia bacterium]
MNIGTQLLERPNPGSLTAGIRPTASYNLIDRPWIPCLLETGHEDSLSLTEVFRRAPEITEMLDSSPLITISLYRLLLTVLHRVCGPAAEAAWASLWQRGHFDCAAIDGYLNNWRHRFDLFDADRPFCQCPGLPERLAAPVTRLAPELASGNQPTLFDHHLDASAPSLAPAAAARCLLAHQSFCLSGCCGDESGLTAVRSGPLAHAAIFMATGRNLFETLLLNLVPYNPQQGLPLPVLTHDVPQWERDHPPTHEARLPDGYLDYLTWPSRRILLLPNDDATVSRVIVMPGADFPAAATVRDPMLAYHGPCHGAHGLSALRLEPGGSWWRDCLALFAARRGAWQRPKTLDCLAYRADCGLLPPDYCYSLAVFGLAGAKARADHWQHHRQPGPVAYLADDDLAADLETALGLAQDIHQALTASLWQASQALAFGPSGSTVPLRRMASGSPASAYWRALEMPARALVHDLPGDLAHRDSVLRDWLRTCERLAWQELEGQLQGLRHEPRGLRAEVLARDHLARELGRLAAPWLEVASEAV